MPDWVRLMEDVTWWEHDTAGERVRKNWARDFYRTAERISSTPDADADSAAQTATATQPTLFDTAVPDEDEGDRL